MTQKYRYRWPAILGVALAIWFFLGMTLWSAFADGIKNAAIYSVDRSVCGLYVNQDWINQELTNGMTENGIDAETAINRAIVVGQQLQEAFGEEKYKNVVAYCASRRAR